MNDIGSWKAKIYEEPETGLRKIYLFGATPSDVRAYLSDSTKGELSYIKEGEPMKGPSMILTEGMMQALFTALQGQGMKPVEQSYVEGKLEAVQEHLKDMRTLVFEEKHIINIEQNKND